MTTLSIEGLSLTVQLQAKSMMWTLSTTIIIAIQIFLLLVRLI